MKQVNIFSEGSYLLCGNKKYQNKHINLKTIIDAEGADGFKYIGQGTTYGEGVI